jgi:hypothetical protein
MIAASLSVIVAWGFKELSTIFLCDYKQSKNNEIVAIDQLV